MLFIQVNTIKKEQSKEKIKNEQMLKKCFLKWFSKLVIYFDKNKIYFFIQKHFFFHLIKAKCKTNFNFKSNDSSIAY